MDVKELLELAYTYYIGDGYTFDRLKAIDYYKQAIELGSVEAVYYCALCYEYLGCRDKKNYEIALEYFNSIDYKDSKTQAIKIKERIKLLKV